MTSKTKSKVALFPGSFDPFHDGHYAVLMKAQQIFDEVIIFIGVNPNKKSHNLEARAQQVSHYLKQKGLSNKVIYGNQYTVDVAVQNHCDFLIRGLRNDNDFKYEIDLYQQNKFLNPKIETIYFIADEEFINLHSSNKK